MKGINRRKRLYHIYSLGQKHDVMMSDGAVILCLTVVAKRAKLVCLGVMKMTGWVHRADIKVYIGSTGF